MPENDHNNLLQRARRLDEKALNEIYGFYSPPIYRYAMRLLADQALAEDCVAETFSRLLTALNNGGGPKENLSAYLYRIAHNWITDLYRTRMEPVDLDLDTIPDPEPNPGRELDRQEQAERMRQALRLLTPDQRQVISLKYLEELDHTQIAEIMQKPVGAVKALQHRGLAALRRLILKDQGDNP